MKSENKDKYIDVDEAQSDLASMSKADRSRILLGAKQHAYGTGLESEDLLGEVIQRVLEGKRRIPIGLSIVTALIMDIKSVASCERSKRSREDVLDPSDMLEKVISVSSPSAEDVSASRDEINCLFSELEHLFSNDSKGYAVLIGKMEGYSKDETIKLEPMTDLEFEAARKRVARTLLGLKNLGGKL